MTDDEFAAACEELMDLIDADGASATITDHTISIDLHDWQVTRLVGHLKGSLSYDRERHMWKRLRRAVSPGSA